MRDLDTRLRRERVSAEFTPLFVIVGTLEFFGRGGVVAFWEMYGCDLEVVWGLTGRVRPEKQPVDGVGLVRRSETG